MNFSYYNGDLLVLSWRLARRLLALLPAQSASFLSKLGPTKVVSSRRRRGLLADAEVALRGLLYAAEASAHAAGHHVFERSFAAHAQFGRHAGHSLHHWVRAAGGDLVEALVLEYAMVGDEALFACRSVLGGDQYLAQLAKFFQFKQVALAAGAQQEGGLCAHSHDLLTEIEQGSNAYAAADEQPFVLRRLRHGESIAQGKHAVERVALVERGQVARALADGGHQEPQLVAVVIDQIDGDRAAEEGVGGNRPHELRQIVPATSQGVFRQTTA